jgi:glycosyltransferase involved in cell wall biosynthesis
VIFPVYNEEEIVEGSLTTLSNFLRRSFSQWEVLVIESGSTDRSAGIVDAFSKRHEHIRVFHQKEREGFGSAVRLGYSQALMDLIWLVPPDICFPLDAIITAIPLLSEHECVLSYRSEDSRKLIRRIVSFFYNCLAKTVFGLKQKHVNSAFKLFKSSLVKSLNLRSNGWFIDAEILIALKKRNAKYAEIPVRLIDRTAGKTSITWSTVFSILREMLSCLTHR